MYGHGGHLGHVTQHKANMTLISPVPEGGCTYKIWLKNQPKRLLREEDV